MRRPSPIPCLLTMAAAILATLTAHAHTPGATVRPFCGTLRLAAETDVASVRLCRLLETGELPDMRWPDFTNYREQARQFYGPAFSLAWTNNSTPTLQARALIQALRRAEERGLEPEDYDASRWADRLARLASANVSAEELARFDLALTVSALRYISHVHHGRLNPADLQSGPKVAPFDAAGFLKREVVAAADVPAALAQAEPTWPGYGLALKALQDYLVMARGGEGDPIPRGDQDVYPDSSYAGVMQIAAKLRRTGDLSADAKIARPEIYEEPLVSAVKHFEGRNGIEVDGILGSDTYSKLDTPLAQRAVQLKLALERWRWLPADLGTSFIAVNIPEFRLRAYENGRQALTMKVIVGEASGSHTPVFADRIESLVFRPYWRLPLHVQKNEVLPDLRKDPRYLAKNHMEVVNSSGHVVDALTPAVLQQLDSGKLAIRQQPGDGNALGLVKFVFPGREGIYLHGTSETNLFSSYRRDFSHGCIRVEHPTALASWVLRSYPEWTSERVENAMVGNQSINVKLGNPVPVFVLYNTAVVEENGDVHFFDDIYGQDGTLEKALAASQP